MSDLEDSKEALRRPIKKEEPVSPLGAKGRLVVPSRKGKLSVMQKERNRKAAAKARARNKLGDVEFERLGKLWKTLKSAAHKKDHSSADGIIMSLLQQNLSQREIQETLGCGVSRIGRVRKKMMNPGLTVKRPPPYHAITPQQEADIRSHIESFDTEDGYPCAHRRPKSYFLQEGLNWKKVHDSYRKNQEQMIPKKRVVSYKRWLQKVHVLFPGLRTSRSKEDVCDCCVMIAIKLLDPDLSDEDKVSLEAEKAMHLKEAIVQRKAWSNFVKEYLKRVDPNAKLPKNLIPMVIEDDPKAEEEAKQPVDLHGVQLLVDDFGGGLSLPFYGYSRPSSDYFNSNLILHNFISCDITAGVHRVMLYDERSQGKGCDAVCSMRLGLQLKLNERRVKQGTEAKMCMTLLDNCVGQNKSQAVMQFYAMIQLIFYPQLACLYLKSGHSHMVADRVVGWTKGILQGKNLYHPLEIAAIMSKVRGVDADFLQASDNGFPFRIG